MTINKKVDHKKLWFISLDGMATGFFASLIVAFFVGLIGYIPGLEVFTQMKTILAYLTPFVIGMTIGIKAEKSMYQIIGMGLGAMLVGHSSFHPEMESMKESYFSGFENIGPIGFNGFPGLENADENLIPSLTGVGDAFSAWLTGVAFLYIFNIFQWESTFDFIIIPVLCIMIGMLGMTFITFFTQSIAGLLGFTLGQIGDTRWLLILMSPIIAIVMGVTLSLPISSAALAIMIGMNREIATISLAGTASQMLAFAVITYFGNKDWSETSAVGFGTSMFQLKNFVKKPKLFIIPIIASAVSGLTAAIIFTGDWTLFDPAVMGTGATSSAGMGWAAWYGPVLTIVENGSSLASWVFLILCQIIIPLTISIPLAKLFYKKEWLKPEEVYLWAVTKNIQQNTLPKQVR